MNLSYARELTDQDIVLGSKKEKPKSIQYESITPKTIKDPSIMTICPLRCDFDVSLCQVGTVEVFIPFPNPVIRRAAMSCPRLKEEHCNAAPITMITEPTKIVRFLPRKLPSQIVATAPKKQPRVYPPTVIP